MSEAVKMPRQARKQLEAATLMEQQIQQSMNQQPQGVVSIEAAVAGESQPGQQIEQPAQAQTPPPVEQKPTENFEQLYRTFRGRYEAEIPRLQTQLQAAQRDKQETENRLTQLENELRQMRDKPGSETLSPKDVESFGADLVEMVRRQSTAVIEQAVQNAVGVLNERIARLEQSLSGVKQVTAESAEQMFYTNLTRLVPDYQQVNVTQAFLEWLGEMDPVYGEPRQAALDRAAKALNAERVAAVFNAFKQTLHVPTPAPVNDLASQVAPARSSATPPPAPVDGQLISQASITKFYDDMRRGVYRGRDAEAIRMETAINKALAEGRVV